MRNGWCLAALAKATIDLLTMVTWQECGICMTTRRHRFFTGNRIYHCQHVRYRTLTLSLSAEHLGNGNLVGIRQSLRSSDSLRQRAWLRKSGKLLQKGATKDWDESPRWSSGLSNPSCYSS